MRTDDYSDRVGNHAHNSRNPVADVTGASCVNCVDTFERNETAKRLIVELRSKGVSLSIDADGRLSFDAPAGVLTDDRLRLLRSHRRELLAIVELSEERAAIADCDSGLSRPDAERIASGGLVPRAVAPESLEMPDGIRCPFCPGRSMIDDPRGCRCVTCGRMAWVVLPSGSIVRADFAKTVF